MQATLSSGASPMTSVAGTGLGEVAAALSAALGEDAVHTDPARLHAYTADTYWPALAAVHAAAPLWPVSARVRAGRPLRAAGGGVRPARRPGRGRRAEIAAEHRLPV